MKLEQQVVSLEIAKRLKELGVKQESLWVWEGSDDTSWYLNAKAGSGSNIFAFSVAELGEMLPSGRYEMTSNHLKWWALWKSEQGFSADTEAGARGKMLIYLLENQLVKP